MTALVLRGPGRCCPARAASITASSTRETASQPLEREIAATTARGGARWVAYRIRIAGGRRSMDCFDRARIALESATELSILARFEGTTLVRLRTATPDCEIDAGGLPVTWLEGVKADESAAWLNSLISDTPSTGERYDRIARPALVALGDARRGRRHTIAHRYRTGSHGLENALRRALLARTARRQSGCLGHRGSDRSRSGYRGQEESRVRAEPAAERRWRSEAD